MREVSGVMAMFHIFIGAGVTQVAKHLLKLTNVHLRFVYFFVNFTLKAAKP